MEDIDRQPVASLPVLLPPVLFAVHVRCNIRRSYVAGRSVNYNSVLSMMVA